MSSGNGSASALEVTKLEAFYGKSQIVFDLDLRVEAGETVAVLGRNGAGKTTTLMAIAGIVSSRAEAIRLAGADITRLPPFRRIRRGLAVVPSGARCFPNLTVRENLDMVRSASEPELRWTIEDVYGTFPVLERLKDSRGDTLSGGERQMLAVARALRAGPSVLLLDEPSEGLAPIVLRDINERIGIMNERGIAVLLAEQSHHFALGTAHRAYFIEKGQAAWEGSAAEAQSSEVLERYLAV